MSAMILVTPEVWRELRRIHRIGSVVADEVVDDLRGRVLAGEVVLVRGEDEPTRRLLIADGKLQL